MFTMAITGSHFRQQLVLISKLGNQDGSFNFRKSDGSCRKSGNYNYLIFCKTHLYNSIRFLGGMSSGEEEGEGEEKKKKKKMKMKMKKPRSTKNRKRTKRGLKGKIKQNAKGVQKEERSHGVHTAVIIEEVPPPPPLAVEGSRLSRR
ncbi:hypothetical protein SLEP1_g46539 [Rubroshorea leprosula]|uniref:Uncharacterized protein n=1 Tax=Rubroshorea leprosula TaxID=152421 RepID=A0AAV5LP59_9ROSI|nr:hypothetical protein SLEP1_g46539 [Rubroshorea leprosula]